LSPTIRLTSFTSVRVTLAELRFGIELLSEGSNRRDALNLSMCTENRIFKRNATAD
jgi:hypothetical protein